MSEVKNITIVGGGTAGWLSAAYLAKALGSGVENGANITLIESADIPTIGVGEATVPLIVSTMRFLGLNEAEFMRSVSATFKLAIRFDDWLYEPAKNKRHSYYHAFGIPVGVGEELIAPYWVLDRERSKQNFVDYSMIEGRLCDHYSAPKRTEDADFTGPFPYAYHFDAGQLADYLKAKSKSWGVTHIVDEVTDVEQHDNGNIKQLVTKNNGKLAADLFIDCTGFASVLIEKKLASPWRGMSSVLFCDSAVAIQVPREDESEEIPPFTTSTAKQAGWIWDIGLADRRGTGHVYSSDFMDDDQAENILRQYIGDQAKDLNARKLKMRVGYREQQWVGNCVSIGLSAGFAEPLESTGIFMIELGLARLANLLPNDSSNMQRAANRFNQHMSLTYESVYDFIKLHYCLSERTDSEFWEKNRSKETWPDTLVDNLEQWKTRAPSLVDFPNIMDPFKPYSYHQILYGMNHFPDLAGLEGRYAKGMEMSRNNANIVNQRSQNALQALPGHRELVNYLYSKVN